MSRTTKKSTRLDTGHVHDGGAIATRTRWAAAIEPAYYHSQRHTSIALALALALASCCRTRAISGSRPYADHTDRFYRESAALRCSVLFVAPWLTFKNRTECHTMRRSLFLPATDAALGRDSTTCKITDQKERAAQCGWHNLQTTRAPAGG
jgi:hypothetical protein